MKKIIRLLSKLNIMIICVALLFPQVAYATEVSDENVEVVEESETDDSDNVESEENNTNSNENTESEETEEVSDSNEEEVSDLDNDENSTESETEEEFSPKNPIEVTLYNSEIVLELDPESYEMYPETRDIDYIKLNSENLQKVVDAVADAGGGCVVVPEGNYYFYPSQKNFDIDGSILSSSDINYVNYFVIKCRDNVTVSGTLLADGTVGTTFLPIANLSYPVDMFYFADLIDRVEDKYDTDQAKWLVNADFQNFIIDYSNTVNYGYYNAKGKGFYIVLLRDCDWYNVTVKNTDGTGFGVDCPINCSMTNCTAISCGKQATSQSVGGSGFGIGFGYSNEESIIIDNCLSIGNRKFGFFFENQARFERYYQAETSNGFTVKNCIARGNLYDFGGEMCSNTYYIDCISEELKETDPNPLNITNKLAYYFGTNSKDFHIIQNGEEINQYYANRQYYTDVNGWFVDEGWFEKILASEIMYGYKDTNGNPTYVFGQEDPVTRGQVAVMLYRYCYPDSQQNTQVKNTTPFVDNLSNVYYTEAMNWAYDQGIFTGYKNPDGSLSKYIRPEKNITREELATVFYRFAGKEGADIVNYDKDAYKHVSDVDSISFWALDAVAWCYSNNVMTGGVIDGCLKPADVATRSQAAKMILQTIETIK